MRAMAVRADGGGLRAVLHRVSVDAVLVGHKDLRAAAGRLHQKLLPVACAAGGGNVGVVHGRLWIAGGQNCVRVAVTIDAGGSGRSVGLLRGGVEAVLIRGLRVGVALGAGDLRGSRGVRRGLHVLVAVHAGEHSAVDGLLKFSASTVRLTVLPLASVVVSVGSAWQARHSSSFGLCWARASEANESRRTASPSAQHLAEHCCRALTPPPNCFAVPAIPM